MWKRMHTFRRRAVVALIACLVVSLTAVSPAPATSVMASATAPASVNAAVSCYIICDGQDPRTAVYEDSNGVLRRCNDARTIYSSLDWGFSPGGYVELRYSRKCRMAWARGLGGIKVKGFNADGSLRVAFKKWAGPNRDWTVAVNDAGLTASACIWDYASQHYVCGPRY